MSTPSSVIASKLADLISSIGGPDLDVGSIERLGDLHAGKLLLDWLIAQLEIGFGEEEGGRRLFASIQNTVLEKDEVLILNRVEPSETNSNAEQSPLAPSDYMLPSRLKKHAEYINKEAELVQREAELIRARISETKEASKKITHSIKLLQRAVFDLDSNACKSEERISELSIKADTTIASTLNDAHGLLQDLGLSKRSQGLAITADVIENLADISPQTAPDLESARSLPLATQNELSGVTTNLRHDLKHFALLHEQQTAKILDLQVEAERLQKALSSENGGNNSAMAMKSRHGSLAQTDDPRLTKELEDICVLLEREVALRESGGASGDSALDALLSELDEVYRIGSVEDEVPAVEEMLRQAWSLDQAAILKVQEEVLDEALASLDSASLPLEQMHSSLSRLARCVQDAEAVLEALAEELGEIHLHDRNTSSGYQEEELERQLKYTLGDLKDLRPTGAAPMLLLTQDDVLAELRSLVMRAAALETSERAWADDLVHKYFIPPLRPALTQIYAHSPLNTSPPFSFPADVRELEAQTRSKAMELHKLTNSLEEEVRETFAKQSNLKRLNAFVNKWSATAVALGES
ncbi:hypothetical protein GALMADRAFT_142063 [Galerina marginata CBS 339.88]|uniref:Uncharacterized protein n=1 Tax=Galerina marginata (strain CBS 339.88) TaxID=685588 RepID=A0A067SRM0_GALM3|nr:hypothetical protein GALMADRAFT_142063 [Galerina marginata CBS 339.88]